MNPVTGTFGDITPNLSGAKFGDTTTQTVTNTIGDGYNSGITMGSYGDGTSNPNSVSVSLPSNPLLIIGGALLIGFIVWKVF